MITIIVITGGADAWREAGKATDALDEKIRASCYYKLY